MSRAATDCGETYYIIMALVPVPNCNNMGPCFVETHYYDVYLWNVIVDEISRDLLN